MKKHLLTILCLGVATLSFGQTAAIDWTSNDNGDVSSGSTRGYAFDVTNPGGITVTHLSVYDEGANGLAASHDVGIWDSTGTLLVSTTISSGTTDPLDSTGKFRTKAITPFSLAVGTNYVVGASFAAFTDRIAFNISGMTVGDGITYNGGRFINTVSTGLTFPTNGFANGIPGGSFSYEAVPEPTSLAIIGLAGLAAIRRKKN